MSLLTPINVSVPKPNNPEGFTPEGSILTAPLRGDGGVYHCPSPLKGGEPAVSVTLRRARLHTTYRQIVRRASASCYTTRGF